MNLQISNRDGTTSTVLFSRRHKELILKYKWKINSAGYVYAYCKNGHHVVMHRLVLGLKKGDGVHCDHINRNRLDNRDENLRACTHAQNMLNRKPQRGSSSKYKGVSYHNCGKYQAVIRHQGKDKYLGIFSDESDAAMAYDKAAKELHGEFAYLNFK